MTVVGARDCGAKCCGHGPFCAAQAQSRAVLHDTAHLDSVGCGSLSNAPAGDRHVQSPASLLWYPGPHRWCLQQQQKKKNWQLRAGSISRQPSTPTALPQTPKGHLPVKPSRFVHWLFVEKAAASQCGQPALQVHDSTCPTLHAAPFCINPLVPRYFSSNLDRDLCGTPGRADTPNNHLLHPREPTIPVPTHQGKRPWANLQSVTKSFDTVHKNNRSSYVLAPTEHIPRTCCWFRVKGETLRQGNWPRF